MNISILTLGALLASSLNAGAQTATRDTVYKEPVKNTGTEKTTAQTQDSSVKGSLKPVYTERKTRHCPTCGRG